MCTESLLASIHQAFRGPPQNVLGVSDSINSQKSFSLFRCGPKELIDTQARQNGFSTLKVPVERGEVNSGDELSEASLAR